MNQENELLSELDKLADEYFPLFETCSQTSLYALNRVFNLGADEFIKSLASMPGIALRGETCGAVTGCLLAIGMAYEQDLSDPERKNQSREPSFEFCTHFENKFGSTRCRDVIEKVTGRNYALHKPEDYSLLELDGVYSHCPAIIKEAVHIAARLIMIKGVKSYDHSRGIQ